MAASKKKSPQVPALFSRTAKTVAKPNSATDSATKEPDYDRLVPAKMQAASDTKIRCLIAWADYCYWVKSAPIMSDHTFDVLVREYQKRCPDDQAFIDKLGMW